MVAQNERARGSRNVTQNGGVAIHYSLTVRAANNEVEMDGVYITPRDLLTERARTIENQIAFLEILLLPIQLGYPLGENELAACQRAFAGIHQAIADLRGINA